MNSDNWKDMRIRDIYKSVIRSAEYNGMLIKNECDTAWLKKKISEKDLYRLKNKED